MTSRTLDLNDARSPNWFCSSSLSAPSSLSSSLAAVLDGRTSSVSVASDVSGSNSTKDCVTAGAGAAVTTTGAGGEAVVEGAEVVFTVVVVGVVVVGSVVVMPSIVCFWTSVPGTRLNEPVRMEARSPDNAPEMIWATWGPQLTAGGSTSSSVSSCLKLIPFSGCNQMFNLCQNNDLNECNGHLILGLCIQKGGSKSRGGLFIYLLIFIQ